MTTKTIGALFVGAGLGILLGLVAPGLAWLWPLGLIVGGALLWRKARVAALGVAAAALTLALTSAPLPFTLPTLGERQLICYEITGDEADAWRYIRRLVVVNTVGNISAEVGEDPGVRVCYRGTRRAARPPARVQASYDASTGTLRVIGLDPRAPERARRGLRAEVEVVLPRSLAVELHTEVGDVRVREADDVEASTDVGDVTVWDATGAVTARSRVGSIELSFDRPLAGDVEASTEIGSVRLTLPESSSASVRAITGMREFGGALERVTDRESRLTLGAGEHQVDLRTRVGKIEVRPR